MTQMRQMNADTLFGISAAISCICVICVLLGAVDIAHALMVILWPAGFSRNVLQSSRWNAATIYGIDMSELLILAIKYSFLLVLSGAAVYVGRALRDLARHDGRVATSPPTEES